MRLIYLFGFSLCLVSAQIANATCGRQATESALAALTNIMEHQTALVPEEPPIDLGQTVRGSGASLVNRTFFTALQIYTKGSVTGFFQCGADGSLTLKALTWGNLNGEMKSKTLSFD